MDSKEKRPTLKQAIIPITNYIVNHSFTEILVLAVAADICRAKILALPIVRADTRISTEREEAKEKIKGMDMTAKLECMACSILFDLLNAVATSDGKMTTGLLEHFLRATRLNILSKVNFIVALKRSNLNAIDRGLKRALDTFDKIQEKLAEAKRLADAANTIEQTLLWQEAEAKWKKQEEVRRLHTRFAINKKTNVKPS